MLENEDQYMEEAHPNTAEELPPERTHVICKKCGKKCSVDACFCQCGEKL